MTPQGFGFESRVRERRTGNDRRESEERRLQDRRRRIVPVLMERRIAKDRRGKGRRADHGPRRNLSQQGVTITYLGQLPSAYTSQDIRANRHHGVPILAADFSQGCTLAS